MPIPLPRGWTIRILSLLVSLLVLYGCGTRAGAAGLAATGPAGTATEGVPTAAETLSLPASPASTPTVDPSPRPLRLWLPAYLPEQFLAALELPAGIERANSEALADARLEIPRAGALSPGETAPAAQSRWVYALAAPFPTPLDGVSAADLAKAWQGKSGGALGSANILVDDETELVMNAWLGPASPRRVRVVQTDALLDAAWEAAESGSPSAVFAILPFEAISPRWKVLRIDGQSPLENTFQAEEYPLAVRIELAAEAGALDGRADAISLLTNRDPQKLTVLALTGVTALSRHIGEVMEAKGVTYPARDIGALLAQADLTHISNEVSFYADCPKPGPDRADMRFCSHPRYIELLETVGADIIELTGNHNLDWGIAPYLHTLDLYAERGWQTYGGGRDTTEARRALLVEHNGNRLAFIGCSPAGPEKVWATADKPGSAPCDFPKMEAQIRELRDQGYLPVVTLQAVETDVYLPPPAQGAPVFRKLAAAGAVIVSGSQAHVPQTMTFVGESFVHYGLGNLFFDQMKPVEARQGFVDFHVFYAGRYLGVDLVTTLLEESARPRLMTASERESFLTEIFSLSDWSGK